MPKRRSTAHGAPAPKEKAASRPGAAPKEIASFESWDDLRVFLAVARAGSLSAASRALGVKHTTVGRRIEALESALGTPLFQRTPSGLRPTPAADEILPRAVEMETAALAVVRRARGESTRIEGLVKVTTSEAFTGFLVRRLPELRARHPALLVEVLSGNQSLDLTNGEADVALRLMKTDRPDLTAKRVGTAGWSVYAAAGYLEDHPAPKDVEALRGHDVIGFDETMAGVPGATWLREHAAGARVALRGNSLLSVLNATTAGMGIGVLPCFLAGAEPTLRRLTPAVVGGRDMWLVFHPDTGKIPRVRAVIDFIAEVVKREAATLAGVAVAVA